MGRMIKLVDTSRPVGMVALSEAPQDDAPDPLTQGHAAGTVDYEQAIADELASRKARGLPADRATVEMDLLNSGEIAAFSPPPEVVPHESAAGARARSDAELVAEYAAAEGITEAEAELLLANAGRIAW